MMMQPSPVDQEEQTVLMGVRGGEVHLQGVSEGSEFLEEDLKAYFVGYCCGVEHHPDMINIDK